MEWTDRPGAGAPVRSHRRATRHRHLSLRLAAHGGRCEADTEGNGIRPQADPLREVRLMARTISLALAVVFVFAAVAGIMVKVMPAPLKDSDYLIIGTVATMVSLAVLFVVLIVIS